MKLTECKMCSLCQSRLHTSFGKGRKPASVLILFSAEPIDDDGKLKMFEFVRQLNYELQNDYYYTFALKCCINSKPKLESVKACNRWLSREIELVNPYLIICMGKVASISLFGEQYASLLKQNVFYIKEFNKSDKQIFIGESIIGDQKKIIDNLNKLRVFIKEFYG